MKYIIFLSWFLFASEFILFLVKRSKVKTSKKRNDKGSLILLWITITLCFTFGFMFANYRVWDLSNFIVAGFGLLLILIGLLVRWTSILQLKKSFTVDVAIGIDQKLKTDGMYKNIRHPSYLGLLMIMAGFAICMNSLISCLIVVIPMFTVLFYRISIEEKVLIEEFGSKYIAYKANTKMIIPWVI